MPLAHRIIPTLLVRGRQLVKGKAFDSWRSVGLAAQAARIHQGRGVDELVLLDIAATKEGRGPDLTLVADLSEVCFMPLAVGGGVRTVEDVRALLRAGADKVVLGELANELTTMRSISNAVGRQAIVAAIDVGKDGMSRTRNGTYPWSDAVTACVLAEQWGAGEIMLTSIEREGAMEGYDLDLIRRVSEAVGIPVIAHGGCGSYAHMVEAIDAGASAVAAGSLFLFTEATPAGAAAYLAQHGHETRIQEAQQWR